MRGSNGFVRHLAGRRGDDLDAAGVQLARVDADVGDDDDHARARAGARVDAELAGAARDDEANVAVLLPVAAHGLLRPRRASRRAPAGSSAPAPAPRRTAGRDAPRAGRCAGCRRGCPRTRRRRTAGRGRRPRPWRPRADTIRRRCRSPCESPRSVDSRVERGAVKRRARHGLCAIVESGRGLLSRPPPLTEDARRGGRQEVDVPR